MLEKLATKAWNALAKQNLKLKKWLRVLPPGIWIAAAVIVFVGGRLLWLKASRPPHNQEIVNDFGSVRQIFRSPQINHAGNTFTCMMTTDKGYGLFLCDIVDGRKQIVTELTGAGIPRIEHNLRAWPWSPDDRSFVYSEGENLVISPADTKNASARQTVETGEIQDLVWLNPAEFVYTVGRTNLFSVTRQPDGRWKSSGLPENEKLSRLQSRISCLTAITTNSVAWLQGNYICRISLTNDLPGTHGDPGSSISHGSDAPPTGNLMLWLDASTLQQGDQTPVTELADLSSQNNDAVVYGIPPTYNAPGGSNTLNGKGTIHFAFGGALTNANGLKTRSRLGIAGSTPRTVFTVLRPDRGREMIVSLGTTDSKGSYFGILDNDDVYYLPSGWWGADNSVRRQSGNHWDVLETVYDGATQKGYVNGVFSGMTTYPYNTTDHEVDIGLRPPNRQGGFGGGSDGDFAELLVYNGVLTVAERQRVEDYLSKKWLNTELLHHEDPIVWFDPQLNGITSFSYSNERGEFLLTCNRNEGDSLWRFNPGTANLVQMTTSGSIQGAQWVDEKRCAYVKPAHHHLEITMVDSYGREETNLFTCRESDWFEVLPNGKQILFQGIVSNELSVGIWQYDIAANQLNPIIRYSDFQSFYVKGTPPLYGSLETSSGRRLTYMVYLPLHFDRRKKYPLLIGDSPFYYLGSWPQGGRVVLPAIASEGAFVVCINRDDWFRGLDKWGDEVMTIYQHLIQNPCIDAQQVYLYSSSAETTYMGNLMVNTPGLWKGGIFLNPTDLPDFSKSPMGQQRPKILISGGAEEFEDNKFKRYRADAVESGVLVELAIEPGEGHGFIGNAAHLDRLRAIEQFMFKE